MLLNQTHYPLGNSGNIPWGTIILGVIVIGCVGYLGYQVMQSPTIMPKPKIKEDERK